MTTAVATVKPLSAQHQRFVDEYMKDRNATQAAIRAEYKAKNANVTGPRLLVNVGIAAEIARRTEEYTRTAGIAVVDLLLEAKKIAFSDPRQLFNEQGGMLNVAELPEDVAGTIASVEMMSYTPPGENAQTEFTKKVRFWDKPGAIFKLLEYLKAMPPAVTNVTNNVQINVDKALVNLHAAIAGD